MTDLIDVLRHLEKKKDISLAPIPLEEKEKIVSFAPLHAGDALFLEIKKLMQRSPYCLRQALAISNPKTDAIYDQYLSEWRACAAGLNERLGPHAQQVEVREVLVFHGCKTADSMHSIINEGFFDARDNNARHGRTYGNGNYMVMNPELSCEKYAVMIRDSERGRSAGRGESQSMGGAVLLCKAFYLFAERYEKNRTNSTVKIGEVSTHRLYDAFLSRDPTHKFAHNPNAQLDIAENLLVVRNSFQVKPVAVVMFSKSSI